MRACWWMAGLLGCMQAGWGLPLDCIALLSRSCLFALLTAHPLGPVCPCRVCLPLTL